MKEYIEPKVRYIDIKKFTIPRGFFNQDLNVPKIFDLLYSQPAADVVEVVRCMHCQHLKTNINKENYCDIHSSTWDKFYVKLDDFCSYGERR